MNPSPSPGARWSRRDVLSMAAAATVLTGAGFAVGGPALAATTTYPLGTRRFELSRGSRYLPYKVWYPRSGSGTSEVANAAVAAGRFPLVLFSHGLTGTPDVYADQIRPLAAAGFVVAGPWYPNTKSGSSYNMGDVFGGEQSLDASYVITQMLNAGNQSNSPFYQHLDSSRGVGASGHSAGAMTTEGLLGLKKDTRVTAAVMLAVVSIGSPGGSAARSLIINGDQDPTTTYSAARSLYSSISWPKAFLTHVGGSHDSYVWRGGTGYQQTSNTLVDWMRWSLNGDTAARGRLGTDAASSRTRWETSGV